MTIKKTFYATVMLLAVASMVVPNVRADVRRPGARIYNRSFKERNFDRLTQFQNAPGKVAPSKPRPNGGFTKQGGLLDRVRQGEYPVLNVEQNLLLPNSAASKLDPAVLDLARNPRPVTVTAELREKLGIRPSGAVSESAASRQARLTDRFAAAKRGLERGGAATANVLPSAEIADGSSLSAIGFVGISGTEDFFDEAVLLGDLDGNFRLEHDFDTSGPINSTRTFVDRQAKVEDDVLLPDEVYTSTAVSGHNAANGFNAPTDFNVFYTATSAGFINVIGDSVCDGDLLADTVLSVVALTSVVVPGTGGRTFSNSAAVTGLAVVTDTEYDGDLATDEIVWFSVFDPEFGLPASASSALCFMLDSDGDDIPDAAGVGVFATSTEISIAGVATDSFGDVYWQLSDLVVGRILKAWDVDEDRLPDIGFAVYNAVANIDLFNAANAVAMTTDRANSLYLQVAGTGFGPSNTGLPSHVASYIDRCGDFDPLTGFIPRQDQFADTSFRIFAADAEVAQPAGVGEAPATLVIPGMQIDYVGSAYRGLAVDWDDNVYVAYGAAPASVRENPSPLFGGILRIPDSNCDRVGDAVDYNGDGVYGGSIADEADSLDDYRWLDSPLNPGTASPNGLNFISIGPLFSLERVGLGLGDDEGIGFAFDDFDGDANNVAGGVCDLLLATACDNVGTQTLGGPVGFEWLFCNTAWTGFRLGSNGNIVFRDSTLNASGDPLLTDFTPTVVEFLASDAPQVAPLWTDLTPGGGGQFSLHHLGFAAVDAFIIRTINVPSFGRGGIGVGVDQFGFPSRGETNNFDVTFFDDQDAWDDLNAEIVGDETNLNNLVNDDNDGICFPTAVGLRPGTPTRLIDRNGDGDLTDEGLANVTQEGVGRIKPEQGPFRLRYYQMEAIGTPGAPIIVGFSTGFDGVFNTGTVPPGLCEVNLSAATPAEDDPFFNAGCIGMGTEPSLYEFFNMGQLGVLNPDGTFTSTIIDFDLRQEVPADCIARPERFLDTAFADCLCFTGSNMPVGLFCQSIDITDIDGNDDPFLGDANLQINGFCFPMPTSGENSICPQEC